jgi:hypothetical protein
MSKQKKGKETSDKKLSLSTLKEKRAAKAEKRKDKMTGGNE